MSREPSPCAFCGHPDSNHRVYDAAISRIDAGEPIAEVLEDYGLGPVTVEELRAMFEEEE